MTTAEAEALAKELAAEYKPSYFTTIEDFEPHNWVVQAILVARSQGFKDGMRYAINNTKENDA